MEKFNEYYKNICDIFKCITTEENGVIKEAINKLETAIINKQNIYVFGASHAGILSEELFYRAGGLAIINPILEPSIMLNVRPVTATSEMERLEGYGTIIANKYSIKTGDVVICHSVSGRNCVMIDFVLKAKSKGAIIIAMTNVSYSKQVQSKHSSNKNLFEIADVVIDNHGEIGDACVGIEGLNQKVSPTSTVTSTFVFNAIIAQVTQNVQNKGYMCPVLHSANVDGGDQLNREIFKEFKDNIHYL